MYVSDSIGINEKGHLTMGGCDTVELAAEYGTPLFVYDENSIRKNCRDFVASIDEYYDGKGLVLYASKAFSCLEMCRICKQENMGLDVVSGGELYTALSVDFPPEKICFHGNNKSPSELKQALEANVGRIVVDNAEELNCLNSLAASLGVCANILLRIKPGVDAHTHDFVRTGQIDSKFGFALETGEAIKAVKMCFETPNISLKGLHCHIGSQIFDIDPFVHTAEVMIDFMAQIKAETGVELEELNLGGGFGIKYKLYEQPESFGSYMKKVSIAIKASAKKHGINTPFIMIEPGRAIVGAEGITLYRVGSVKKIPDVRTYIAVDGGMVDNPRYILYQSKYEVFCANKALAERECVATIAGKCCESGDLVQEHTKVQRVEAGDLLAVLSTGAYNYSMASNYNRICRPAVVMISDGSPRVIIKRESYQDLIMNDI